MRKIKTNSKNLSWSRSWFSSLANSFAYLFRFFPSSQSSASKASTLMCLEVAELPSHQIEITKMLQSVLAPKTGAMFFCLKDERVFLQFQTPRLALEAAISIRQGLSEMNTQRVVQGKRVVRSYIALVHAEVAAMSRSLNLLEWAKPHFVEMACDDSFHRELKKFEMSRPLDVIRESQQEFLVYELFAHSAKSVRDFKLSTKVNLQKIAEAKKQGDLVLMKSLLDQLIESCPKHTFLAGQLMDATLFVLRKECVGSILPSEPGHSASARRAS